MTADIAIYIWETVQNTVTIIVWQVKYGETIGRTLSPPADGRRVENGLGDYKNSILLIFCSRILKIGKKIIFIIFCPRYGQCLKISSTADNYYKF